MADYTLTSGFGGRLNFDKLKAMGVTIVTHDQLGVNAHVQCDDHVKGRLMEEMADYTLTPMSMPHAPAPAPTPAPSPAPPHPKA